MVADLECLRLWVVAVQHFVTEVDTPDDVHAVDFGEPPGQLTGQISAVHAHPGGQILGGRVQLVQIVLPLIEVIPHLLVRHRDRPAATAVVEPVLGCRRQLGGGDPVAPMQVDHRAGDGRVGADHLGHLGRSDIDVKVAVEGDLTEFGHQPGVVLGGEERGIDPEHLGDAQQHRDGQRPHIVLDLIEVARRDLQHLGQCSLAETTLAAELAHPRSDECLGHPDRLPACEGGLGRVGRRHPSWHPLGLLA